MGKHISSAHGINVEEYKKKHLGFLIKCHDTTLKYTEQNRINCDWIKRKKENGDDLSEYRSKMGNAVRNSIMSNPVERARRSYQLGLNNQTPAARELSRITAIKTSARPDIIAARTKRLQNSYKPSRPESCLMTLLKPYGFTRNCFISDTTFHNGSHRRQVDFVNHNRKIFIEFDGQHHFTSSWKRLALESIQKNDVALDKWVLNNHYTLIRVGWKQFHSRKNELTESCRLALVNLLNQPTLEGVWLIGNEYIQQSHPSASLTGVNNYQLTS